MQDEHKNTETEEQSFLGGLDVGIFKYDVRVFLISLRRRLPFLLLIPVAVIAMTITYIYSMPKLWQATCILFKTAPEPEKENELSTLRQQFSVDVIKEMIRTKDNMRAVITNLKLSESLQSLYGATSVSVDEHNRSMINISAITPDPQDSADIANELGKVFLQAYEKMRNRSVQKKYDYFSRQKILVMNEIKNLEAEKKAYLNKHGISAIALEHSKHFTELSRLEEKITQTEQREYALKIRIRECLEKMQKLEPEVKLSYEVTAVDDTALVMKNNELDILRQRYTDINPKVQKLIAEIKALKKKMELDKKEKRPAGKITYGKNWHLIHLEDEVFAAQTELKSLSFTLIKYAREKKELEEQLGHLDKTANEYKEINRKIELNYDLLRKLDKGVTEMSLALTSSVSDLRVFEKAEPPVYPTVDKRRKILVMGIMLGLVLAGVCAVLLEAIDLTIKSEFDVEHVLHVNVLGSLPRINEVKLKKFYSAIQIVFTRIFKNDLKEHHKKVLIAFGDVEGGAGKTFFIKKCIDIFGPMEKKTLYISSCNELASGLLQYKINDFIYNDQAIDPGLARENNDHLYFLLDNYSYIVPLDMVQIEKFISYLDDYDFIFWELFNFKRNEPLFATICSAAHTTVIMTKFKKSRKMTLVNCIKYLKEHHVKNIGVVINSVEKRYFGKNI
ncbi:MAG: hypothetical protein PHH77_01325 [Victivallaceae bacterium]|nr:hypothetical protein [Victivallaceae bacterium]